MICPAVRKRCSQKRATPAAGVDPEAYFWDSSAPVRLIARHPDLVSASADSAPAVIATGRPVVRPRAHRTALSTRQHRLLFWSGYSQLSEIGVRMGLRRFLALAVTAGLASCSPENRTPGGLLLRQAAVDP